MDHHVLTLATRVSPTSILNAADQGDGVTRAPTGAADRGGR